ncbi:MAG: hypothetical protein ACJ74D_07890 [Gaiellaceae bacterium]
MRLRPGADATEDPKPDPASVQQQTYAVWWEDGDTARCAGKLQLGAFHLLLSGSGSASLTVPLDQIVAVEYLRGELDIQRRDGRSVRIGNLDGVGALLELSHALATAA